MALALDRHGAVIDCTMRRFYNFSNTWTKLGVEPSNGVIVNLGATLGRGGTRNARSNHDASWDLFFLHPELNLRMVAYEGSDRAINETMGELNKPGGHYELKSGMRERVDLVHMYVDPKTIVSNLQQRGVSPGFLLLKVDVDSIDFEAFAAITQWLAPKMVFVERTDWTHTEGMVFTALSRGPGQETDAKYGKFSTSANVRSRFACQGASSSMWRTYHERFSWLSDAERQDIGRVETASYEVVQFQQADGGKNYLLVQSGADAAKFSGPTGRVCFAEPAPHANASWAISYIDTWCNVASTPYYAEVDGKCCPAEVDGRALHLTRCRCSLITDEASFARGGWMLPPRRKVTPALAHHHDHRNRSAH